MKATSESSSNLGSPISMRDVLIRVWDQGYQSPHFRRSRFRPDGITFRITIACRQFPYSAAFTTNINWKKSRLEKFRMSYLRSTAEEKSWKNRYLLSHRRLGSGQYLEFVKQSSELRSFQRLQVMLTGTLLLIVLMVLGIFLCFLFGGW